MTVFDAVHFCMKMPEIRDVSFKTIKLENYSYFGAYAHYTSAGEPIVSYIQP